MHRRNPRTQLLAFVRHLRTQLRYEYSVREAEEASTTYPRPAALATPRQLVQYLDQYVIGQDAAKKVLSVAVFNHYNRVRANLSRMHESERTPHSSWKYSAHEDGVEVTPAQIHPHPHRVSIPTPLPLDAERDVPSFEKSNVLVIGPTGSGKTLLARTLARVLDVPFSVNDATSFTQAGYVGEDVDMCIHRLLQAANWDERRASAGIVYIDEVDKLARKTSGGEGQRDVGGEGVQQALLRMIEGTSVPVHTKGAPVPDAGTSAGMGRPRSGQKGNGSSDPEVYNVDTSNVLFIFSGAFMGLDKIVKQRLSKGSIGFTANLSHTNDESNDFVPFFTHNGKASPTYAEMVEANDIVKFGFIPEFVSRMPTITTLTPLSHTDLLRILTDVRGSLVSQYTALFGYSGVEIKFTTRALKEICRKAFERGGGARGLRGIMENLLLDPMYEVPGSNVKYVLITEAVAKDEQPALYWTKNEGQAFWTAWAEEES